MNFEQVSVSESSWSIEQVVSAIKKKSQTTMGGGYIMVDAPSELVAMGLSVLLKMYKTKLQESGGVHLTERANFILATGHSVIKPGKMTVIPIGSKPIDYDVEQGYFVDRSRPNSERVPELIASALTDFILAVNPPVIGKTFLAVSRNVGTPAKFKFPVLDVVNGENAMSKAQYEGAKDYSMVKTRLYKYLTENKYHSFVASAVVGSLLSAAPCNARYVEPFNDAQRRLFQLAKANLRLGVERTHMIKYPVPLMRPVDLKSDLGDLLELAYLDMSEHRGYRGVDKSMKNLPFNGYYFGSLDQANSNLLWQLTDVMSVVKMFNLEAVVLRMNVLSLAIRDLLVLNKVSVFILNDRTLPVAQFDDEKQLIPGIYRYSDQPIRMGVYDSDKIFMVEPVVRKSGTDFHPKLSLEVNTLLTEIAVAAYENYKYYVSPEEGQDAEEAEINELVVNDSVPLRFFHVRLSPLILEGFARHLMPSTHAHAGHAIFCSRELQDFPDDYEKTLVFRMMQANAFKTYFPYSRRIYGPRDPFSNFYSPVVFRDKSLDVSDVNFIEIDEVAKPVVNVDFDYDSVIASLAQAKAKLDDGEEVRLYRKPTAKPAVTSGFDQLPDPGRSDEPPKDVEEDWGSAFH